MMIPEASNYDVKVLQAQMDAARHMLWDANDPYTQGQFGQDRYCQTTDCQGGGGIFNFTANLEVARRRYNAFVLNPDENSIAKLAKDSTFADYYAENGYTIEEIAKYILENPNPTTWDPNAPTGWGNGEGWMFKAAKSGNIGTTDYNGIYYASGGDFIYTDAQRAYWESGIVPQSNTSPVSAPLENSGSTEADDGPTALTNVTGRAGTRQTNSQLTRVGGTGNTTFISNALSVVGDPSQNPIQKALAIYKSIGVNPLFAGSSSSQPGRTLSGPGVGTGTIENLLNPDGTISNTGPVEGHSGITGVTSKNANGINAVGSAGTGTENTFLPNVVAFIFNPSQYIFQRTVAALNSLLPGSSPQSPSAPQSRLAPSRSVSTNPLQATIPENPIPFTPINQPQYLSQTSSGSVFYTNNYRPIPQKNFLDEFIAPQGIVLHWDENPYDPVTQSDLFTTDLTYKALIERKTSVHFAVDPNGVTQFMPIKADSITQAYGNSGLGPDINIEFVGIDFDKKLPPQSEIDNAVDLISRLVVQYDLDVNSITHHINQEDVNPEFVELIKGLVRERIDQMSQ
jgi:hypothetical protein